MRYLNGFSVLAVVVAFAIGAGIGSGLGHRMGSSRVSVYTQDPDLPGQMEEPTQSTIGHTNVEEEQSRTWVALQGKLESLELRLDSLQQQVSDVSQSISNVSTDGPQATLNTADRAHEQQRGQLQTQLQSAGFTDGEYDVISATRNELQLKRLQMRDKAIREGWYRTDSWSRQLRELDPDTELRNTLGDQRFDDYLIATGRNNRVRVDELMMDSVAEQAGLLAGDLIHRYADQRVFSSFELRNLTSGGQVGENTALTVLRDGELVDLFVPRGPLGVMISATRAPDNVNR